MASLEQESRERLSQRVRHLEIRLNEALEQLSQKREKHRELRNELDDRNTSLVVVDEELADCRQEIQRLQRQIQREQSIREAGREGGCPEYSATRVGSVGAERGADEKATRLREKEEEAATLKGHLKRQEENYCLF